MLYGGNAILYHVAMSEYAELLALLAESAAEESLVIPSVGPAYGTMMDQQRFCRDFAFPTAMILPQRDLVTSKGIGTVTSGDSSRRPNDRRVLYIKHDGFIDVPDVQPAAWTTICSRSSSMPSFAMIHLTTTICGDWLMRWVRSGL